MAQEFYDWSEIAVTPPPFTIAGWNVNGSTPNDTGGTVVGGELLTWRSTTTLTRVGRFTGTGDMEIVGLLPNRGFPGSLNWFATLAIKAGTFTSNANRTGYLLSVDTDGMLNIGSYNGTTTFTIYSTSVRAITDTDRVMVRFRCEGTTFYGKFWRETEIEPVAWDITEVLTSYTTGYVGFVFFNSAVYRWGPMGIGTDGDTAPLQLRFLSGRVTDDAEPPNGLVGKTVIGMEAETGNHFRKVVTDASGYYLIPAQTSKPFSIVALNEDENAQVLVSV